MSSRRLTDGRVERSGDRPTRVATKPVAVGGGGVSLVKAAVPWPRSMAAAVAAMPAPRP